MNYRKIFNLKQFFLLLVLLIGLIVIILLSISQNENFVLNTKTEKAMNLNTEGKILMSKGMYDKAKKCFLKAINVLPDCRDIYVNLARIYISQGNYRHAISLLLKTVKTRSSETDKRWLSDFSTASIYYLLGVAYRGRGNYESALSIFHKVLELDSDLIASYLQIGDIYKIQGKYDQAITSYQKVIFFKPDIKKTYISMLKENLDYFKEGNQHYETIRVQLKNGITDHDLAEYDNTVINESIERESIFFNAYNNLGIVFHEQGRLKDSVEHFLKATKIIPNDITFFNLAVVYEKKGEIGKAIQALKYCLQLNPDNIIAKKILSEFRD